MPDLHAIQREFAAALRDTSSSPRAAARLAGDAALVAQRLAIYRGNVLASAIKALSATFPVIQKVVGVEFFEGLVRAYLRARPSTSGDLTDYGDRWPAFVAEFPHTQSLPYLPDLARLEWAVHRAYGAADATPLDATGLAAVPPERQSDIRFAWAPGTAVVESRFPLARIWALHQSDYAGEFEVDWSLRQAVLVARSDFAVTVAEANAGDAAFLSQSLAGAPLGDATTAALETDPAFDLGALLARAMSGSLICGFSLASEGEHL